MKTFPIPSAPAGPGGEDKPKPVNKDDDRDTDSYARGGFVKGEGARAASYAVGGPVYGRTRDFMKEPSPFRDDQDFPPGKRKNMPEDQAYEKSGKGAPGKDKSAVKTPLPRK